jgi:hypothetical protein
MKRDRLLYGACLVGIIVAGLGTRRSGRVLPEVVAVYGGDTLWALMVFVSLGFINGEVVHSFDQAVPDVITSLSVRETISMLFGHPPTPTAEEGAIMRRRARWRLWS